MRILIVEDEAITAMHLEAVLEELGHDVCAIEATGEGAITAAARHLPDLVLMDVRLAGRMDGIAAAATIRNGYGIPSLIVTAFVDPGTRQRLSDCLPLGVISKPYSVNEIRQTLAGLVPPRPSPVDQARLS